MEISNDDTTPTGATAASSGAAGNHNNLTQHQHGNTQSSSSGSNHQQADGGRDVITVTRQDSSNSVNSDHCWADKSRVVTLRASNPEVQGGREGGRGEGDEMG